MAETAKDYTISREEGEIVLTLTIKLSILYPNPEDNEDIFEKVVDAIIESGGVTSLVIVSDRNYIYVKDEVEFFDDIADKYKAIFQTDIVAPFGLEIQRDFPQEVSMFNYVLYSRFKRDPIGAFVYGSRAIREIKVKVDRNPSDGIKSVLDKFVRLVDVLSSLLIVKRATPYILGYKVGDRAPYKALLKPIIRPNFTYTRIMAEAPVSAIEVESYKIPNSDNSEVTIYKIPGVSSFLYHLMPPELTLNVDEYNLLDQVRASFIDYKPQENEFVNPLRMREVFFNIGKDLLEELNTKLKYNLPFDQLSRLANILVRLTVGFGITEVILMDENVEDIYLNSPIGDSTLFVKHSKYGECRSNIIPNAKEVEAWASRFRLISGRPLDEGHPVLDTELITENISARVAIAQRPLSPYGLSVALRRHRSKPWTLPLFVDNKMVSPFAAGLLWFMVEGARTFLINGTRGSGKTSFLTALMLMLMKKYRIITVEDTLELPTSSFINLGYDILSFKVQSAIVGEKGEMSADEGIRTTLRLGDSALIIGEVRSLEARALYEAMRVGALSNVVMGTIHSESPYGVFDRVVNDLGVPVTSFKATDIIISTNKIRSVDRLTEKRRVLNITEVRKEWSKDPLYENGFLDLVQYDIASDELKPTKAMLEGDSYVVKQIASNVKGWAGDWDMVLDSIYSRANLLDLLVKYANRVNRDFLEAEFTSKAVDKYYDIVSSLNEKYGYAESKNISELFNLWLNTQK